MSEKILGIIGRGSVVKHFFLYVQNNLDPFLENVNKVIFLNYGFVSDDVFKKTPFFQKVSKALPDISFDVLPENAKASRSSFYALCDVVLDASEGYVPGRSMSSKFLARPHSLYDYALRLSNEESVTDVEINWATDFAIYLAEKKEQNERILMSEQQFQNHWEQARLVIDAMNKKMIGDTEKMSLPGKRFFLSFPFSLPLLFERANELQRTIEKGHSELPTYLLCVNEPCLAASVLAGACPLITPYLVGITGFDVERLEENVNKEYRSELTKAGFPFYKLHCSLAGAHEQFVSVPEVYPQSEEERPIFEKVLSSIDYQKMYDFMLEKLTSHYQDNEHLIETANQVSRAVYQTVIAAMQSRRKALSVFPSFYERPLCNGYFHQSGNEKTGLFFTGRHRFRNGSVFSDVK